MIEFMITVGGVTVKLTAEEARELFKELYDLFYKPTVTFGNAEGIKRSTGIFKKVPDGQ